MMKSTGFGLFLEGAVLSKACIPWERKTGVVNTRKGPMLSIFV